jgi:hypothetical protein
VNVSPQEQHMTGGIQHLIFGCWCAIACTYNLAPGRSLKKILHVFGWGGAIIDGTCEDASIYLLVFTHKLGYFQMRLSSYTNSV